jgi:DNA-binding transcriptional regulator GbsR (MarR family)
VIKITEEEFISWKDSIVTKRLKERIKEDVEYLQNMLLSSDDIESVKELQGRIKSCINLLEVDFEALTNYE